MKPERLVDYLVHIEQAAADACSFVDGMSRQVFLTDKRTQQAVVLSLMVIGEAATKLLAQHSAFLAQHPALPWASMKGMRNRIAHGYFDINPDVVWDTVQTALPGLLQQLPAIRAAAE